MFLDGNGGSIADNENMIIKEVLRVTHFFNFLKSNFAQFHMLMHININYIYVYIWHICVYSIFWLLSPIFFSPFSPHYPQPRLSIHWVKLGHSLWPWVWSYPLQPYYLISGHRIAEDIDTCPRPYHFQIIQEEMGEPCEHPWLAVGRPVPIAM